MSDFDAHLDEILVGGQRPAVVRLAEHDPAWPALFEQHRARVVAALGDVEVEHIGSTAVPGLAAKPVIDLQVVVPSLDEAVGRLVEAGYELRVREPEHRVVRAPDANVHLYLPGDPEPAVVRRFRDRLRSDPAARQRYEDVKRSLAGREWPDMNHYAAAKSDVIREILAEGLS